MNWEGSQIPEFIEFNSGTYDFQALWGLKLLHQSIGDIENKCNFPDIPLSFQTACILLRIGEANPRPKPGAE